MQNQDTDEGEFEHFCVRHHHFTRAPMKAITPVDRINTSNPFVACYGEFQGTSLPPQERVFSFISNKWGNLNLSRRGKEVNLFEYASDLESLMPASHRKTLHLVTYQNGIRNSPQEFKKTGETISKMATEFFGHTPLCMGFYNPTTTHFACDTMRALLRYLGSINRYIIHTTIWFETLLTLIKRNPTIRWMHITHSEGGAIAYLALKMLRIRHQKYAIPTHNLANHLIVSAIAPLHPIPETLIPKSYNIYNTQDKTTLRFGLKFNNPSTGIILPGYDNFRIGKSDQTYKTNFPPGDHDFLGDTYQKLLRENLISVLDKVL